MIVIHLPHQPLIALINVIKYNKINFISSIVSLSKLLVILNANQIMQFFVVMPISLSSMNLHYK